LRGWTLIIELIKNIVFTHNIDDNALNHSLAPLVFIINATTISQG